MTLTRISLIFTLLFTLTSCDFISKKEKKSDDIKATNLEKAYFEGEIELSESRGYKGSLFKIHTNFLISENRIKREQKLGGLNALFNTKAGIIVDLEKDSVTLFYSDPISKYKHTSTIEAYKNYSDTTQVYSTTPSPVDLTFNYLPEYNVTKQVKDSMIIQGFTSDYTLYNASFLQQEIFDTKDIRIKRELLEVVFYNLQEGINFPLKSEVKTIISSIKNDSIINSDEAAMIDKISNDVLNEIDSTKTTEPTDLEKLSKNKLLNKGLDLFKKGVDLAIHFTNEITEISSRKIISSEISLPSGDFDDIDDIEDFFDKLPSGSSDFDD